MQPVAFHVSIGDLFQITVTEVGVTAEVFRPNWPKVGMVKVDAIMMAQKVCFTGMNCD